MENLSGISNLSLIKSIVSGPCTAIRTVSGDLSINSTLCATKCDLIFSKLDAFGISMILSSNFQKITSSRALPSAFVKIE